MVWYVLMWNSVHILSTMNSNESVTSLGNMQSTFSSLGYMDSEYWPG